MDPNDTIRLTRTPADEHLRQPAQRYDLTEAEFRKLLGATLIALATNYDDRVTPHGGGISPRIACAMEDVGEYLMGDDLIGDPAMDYSVLGTFLTAGPNLESIAKGERPFPTYPTFDANGHPIRVSVPTDR